MNNNLQPSAFVQASTLPKPWESAQSFSDILYEWMRRTPWLAMSVVAHLLVFVIVQAIPWNLIRRQEERQIQTAVANLPQETFEDPPQKPEEIEDEVPLEQPLLQDYVLSDHNESDDEAETEMAEGDPDMLASSPFDDKGIHDVIGIGPGAGGKLGNRIGGKQNLRSRWGQGTELALKDGLEWLRQHQSADGRWNAAGFMANCGKIGAGVCDMPGDALHDVGLTGLALLAFLGDGNTLTEGPYKAVVNRGIQWLRQQQDPEKGLIGTDTGHSFMYDHAIAALAMCEAYYFSKSALIKGPAQKAINFIHKARNPYGAWRYDCPPLGDNDTSVTGWMVFALKSASEAGLEIEQEALAGALSWIDEVTDQNSGRVGYDSLGSLSSRVIGINDNFPSEKGEALTSVGLLCRFFLDQDPKDTPIMTKHADLILKKLPEWDVLGKGCDMYYWYYGSYAMYQMGGRHWEAWNKAMKPAILEHQRHDGDSKGSWDPIGPWGWSGGRVYSTALMVLCLEVYYRYARVIGAR